MSDDILDPVEIRVLAVLAEKEALTPDNYPLSLNALTNGCNQLSSRDPVMQLSEETVADTLERLAARKLVSAITQAGARVTKYEHRMRIKWTLEQDKLAILTVLMLRGLQTAGEIRTRTGRQHEFKSVAEVEAGLQFLIDKYPPLVAKLALAPGTKEPRYGHLLGGEEVLAREEAGYASAAPSASRGDRVSQLEQEVQQLREEVAALSAQFEQFRRQFE
ncbi:YceH family protein [Massilia endophytica]|uniref:YceH family protein n=1 Tax=Massilia endophytica TaxID=2899220 RepID=UPI001E4D02DD|nr:YceH family protein [Massilia endophytica]UGQ48130.1 YceH family protein [Massilia endophytica]